MKNDAIYISLFSKLLKFNEISLFISVVLNLFIYNKLDETNAIVFNCSLLNIFLFLINLI